MFALEIKGGDRITQKQRVFADTYVKCLNATEAYMKAYGTKSKNVAGSRGSLLRKKPEINEYIQKRIERASKRAEIEAEKVLELLAAIAFTSPADFATIATEGGKQKILWQEIESLPKEVKKAIAVIKNTPSGISIETLDRLKAIDMLMKYMGIGKEKAEGVVIEGEGDIEA